MRRFLLAFVLVRVGLFVTSWWFRDPWLRFASSSQTSDAALFAVNVLLPVAIAWASVELVQIVRAPKRFARLRRRDHLLLCAIGVVAGVLSVLVEMAGILAFAWRANQLVPEPIVLNEGKFDAIIPAAATLVTVLPILLMLRRDLRWRCRGCGYDLRGVSPASCSACPECGERIPIEPMRSVAVQTPPPLNEARHAGLLLAFLEEGDPRCPACGCPVRRLGRDVCPACGKRLRLGLGIAEPSVDRATAGLLALALCAGGLLVGIGFALLQLVSSPTPWQIVQARTAAIVIAVALVVTAVAAAQVARRTERVRRAGAVGTGLAELAVWGIPAAVLTIVLLLLG